MILVHDGHSVLQAFDGGRGVEMARAHGPDLVLMDLSMPVMNGLEATRLLKADPATAAIPVIALTACTQDEDVAAALRAGCNAFLAKPLEPRRVAAEVRRILADGAAAPPAAAP
jgi:CheY-like chemotaxis protein